MNIQITPAAKAKLTPYTAEHAILLLDLDDGVGSFSKFGVCSLDTSFRVLIVQNDSDLKDYSLEMKSEVGPIYIKEYTKDYFTENPQLDLNPRFQNLVLKSETGIIDNNVEIIDFRAIQAAQEQA